MTYEDLDVVKSEAKRRIHNLVEDYMTVLAKGKKDAYNEERVKIAFVVPLLEALGWNPRTDEILPEQATLTGRADFGLRCGGRTKIFVEMKSFTKNLDGHDTVKGRPRSFSEQAIQYAWGMKADWAVLTNFEETRLYDSHVKKSEEGLVWKKSIRFTEYESRFEELWLISKQSVVSGALDAYKAKIQRPPVDEAFLGDLMNCRQMLAENIRSNNLGLTYDQINESVQKILDRLIFIKNCEDRLIIPAESLWKRYKAWQETAIDKDIVIFMMDLRNLFRYFDQVYNGKLFEKHLCEDLKISNEVLEQIIDTLYGDGQHLGYDFSVIPVDVLGQAYEQYIGSIIKEKEGQGRAVEIVAEPAKRKSHGIYYTPEPVVDYIVRNTLGRILEKCKTPEEVSKIKVVDPACGSGSFLIKAFDVIREWYEHYNKANKPKDTHGTLDAHIVPIPNIEERILTENLFGVDLDPQAVEITILNLSLKAIKTKEKLPYIADHIKCGNSLIADKDIAGDKAFKWAVEFKNIKDEGGFDVILGNPPWSSKIPSETNKILAKELGLSGKNVNICALFVIQLLRKLKHDGFLGFLLPKVIIKNETYYALRKEILDNYQMKQIIDFGQFPGVASDAIGLIVQNRKDNLDTEILFFSGSELAKENKINQSVFMRNPSLVFSLSLNTDIQAILDKILANSTELGGIFRIKRGIELGQKSLIIRCVNCGNYNEAETKYYGSADKKCKKCGNKLEIDKGNVIRVSSDKRTDFYAQECIAGTQVHRYHLDEAYFVPSFLNGIDYKEEAFSGTKILIKRIATKIEGAFSENKLLAFNTVYSIFNKALTKNEFLYTLGIINSKLMHFFYEYSYNVGMNLTTQVTIEFLSRIPIKIISGAQLHTIISLVNTTLSLNRRLSEIGEKLTDEKVEIEKEIKKTDAEIDELVYSIYEVTEDEKEIIEKALE